MYKLRVSRNLAKASPFRFDSHLLSMVRCIMINVTAAVKRSRCPITLVHLSLFILLRGTSWHSKYMYKVALASRRNRKREVPGPSYNRLSSVLSCTSADCASYNYLTRLTANNFLSIGRHAHCRKAAQEGVMFDERTCETWICSRRSCYTVAYIVQLQVTVRFATCRSARMDEW